MYISVNGNMNISVVDIIYSSVDGNVYFSLNRSYEYFT